MRRSKTAVRIYSNGMLDVRTDYSIPRTEPSRFDLVFPKDHLADVLSKIKFYGNVKVVQPPTFVPNNAQEPRLRIDPNRVSSSIFTDMVGATVSLDIYNDEQVTGRVCGIDVAEEHAAGKTVTKVYVVLFSPDGYRRFGLDSIRHYAFVSDDDQKAITETLDALYGAARPGNNTSVSFSLQGAGKGDGDVDCAVQWVVPNAAHVITYRLLIDRKGRFKVEAWATVHNMTSEAWEDATLSVVSGQPHTFASDGADATKPTRRQVRLVDASADGGEVVETAGLRQVMMASRAPAKRFASGGGELESCAPLCAGDNRYLSLDDATEGASVAEVGEMQVFTSPLPYTVPPKKSAAVFLFSRPIAEAQTVLCYSPGTGKRPRRAFLIKNDTGYNLPKGSVSIYQVGDDDSVWTGEAILEATNKAEERLVVYATDTSVSVASEPLPLKTEVTKIHLVKGTGYSQHRKQAVTTYEVRNSGGEPATVYVDHPRRLAAGSDIEIAPQQDGKSLANGSVRATVTCPAMGGVAVRFVETRVDTETHSLAGGAGVVRLVALSRQRLGHNDAVRDLLRQLSEIEAAKAEVEESVALLPHLREQHARDLSVLNALGDTRDESAQRDRLAKLDAAESKIRAITDTTVPALRKKVADLEKRFSESVLRLDAEWVAG